MWLALLDDLAAHDQSLAVSESLTGGLLAATITEVPGASRCFLGGVVAYATDVKRRVLGVSSEVVAEHGVVSEQCAAAMASGVRRLLGATHALSATGVAGPEPQEDKPVGTVWIALAEPGGVHTRGLRLEGDRRAVRTQTCDAAAALLLETLRREQRALG